MSAVKSAVGIRQLADEVWAVAKALEDSEPQASNKLKDLSTRMHAVAAEGEKEEARRGNGSP